MRYDNPVSHLQIGDVVRFRRGTVNWTIIGKGATTGLTLRSEHGRIRTASTFDVSLAGQRREATS